MRMNNIGFIVKKWGGEGENWEEICIFAIVKQ